MSGVVSFIGARPNAATIREDSFPEMSMVSNLIFIYTDFSENRACRELNGDRNQIVRNTFATCRQPNFPEMSRYGSTRDRHFGKAVWSVRCAADTS